MIKLNQFSEYRILAAELAVLLMLLGWIFCENPGNGFAVDQASAQQNAQASIGIPDSSQFPTIKTSLDVFNSQDQFVHGLLPDDVTIYEDGQAAKVDQIQEIEPGVSITVAINEGLPLGIRDKQGKTRFDEITTALQDWIKRQDAENNNVYSLIANRGMLITDASSPSAWLSTLDGYQPDMRSATPNLDSLNQALAMAGDPTPHKGMKRAILYITPPPDENDQNTLAGLSGQAHETGTRIFVWMVGSQDDFTSTGAAALSQLADDTGGQFFAYSGVETLPDIQAYLGPLAYSYELSYQSALNGSGSHTLMAKIKRSDLEVSTNQQSFNLSIKPPSAMFISPPAQIQRYLPGTEAVPSAAGTSPASEGTSATGMAASSAAVGGGSGSELVPDRQILKIMVEFPDGHKRDLIYSRLYVDGKLVAENNKAPFDQFTWDLTGYTTSGQHLLTVEVQDSLGLTTMSSAVPVDVTVTLPQKESALSDFSQIENLLPIAGLATAGPALVILVFVVWRRRRQASGSQSRKHLHRRGTEQIGAAPQMPDQAAHEKLAAGINGAGQARLVRIFDETLMPLPGNPIRIGHESACLGKDPSLSNCLIDEDTVDPLHARINLEENGGFFIYDEGSTAGTWVNLAPVSTEGMHLEHGDLVHIGKMAFRFELIDPAHIRKIKVIQLKKGYDPF